MNKLPLLLACAISCLGSACGVVYTSYQPDRAAYAEGVVPLTDAAVPVYRGDAEALFSRPGTVVLGTMQAEGTAFSDRANVREQVSRDAAKLGATHVVLGAQGAVSAQMPATARTSCHSDAWATHCTTVEDPGATIYRPTALYELVRVPQAEWPSLPTTIRPLAVGADNDWNW